MDATANFSRRFARASGSKIESTDWVLSRQILRRIATRISLVSEAIGFWVLGILIIMNRNQADLNGLAGGSSVPIVAASALFWWVRFSLSRLVYIGGSAPNIRPHCRSGVIRSVSLSLDPIQS
jgi:hypothetical protein